jgi:hypothetical protein
MMRSSRIPEVPSSNDGRVTVTLGVIHQRAGQACPAATGANWHRQRPGAAIDGAARGVPGYALHVSQLRVDLPDDLADLVTAEATRRHVAPADLVMEAVSDYLGRPRRRLGIIGLGASGRSDVSEHVDEEVQAALGLGSSSTPERSTPPLTPRTRTTTSVPSSSTANLDRWSCQ